MIRIVMLGRTGNNLFQYALGRVLAKRHGVDLMMDGSWFNHEGWRAVSCLRRLGLKAEIRRGWAVASRIRRRLTGRHPWEGLGVPVLREASGHGEFEASVLDAPASCVLMGYYQSPRYFESIEMELREEINPGRLEWPDATRRIAGRLASENSVAVHVRRTDFVGNPEFDVCGPGYYQRAMDRLREGLKGLRFHVFSDDTAWCAANFSGDDVEVTHVPGTRDDPLHDLFLMSLAKHHVIANSSYSWWAAWLGKKDGQRVLCPDRWFGGAVDAPMADKLCPGWELVQAAGDARDRGES